MRLKPEMLQYMFPNVIDPASKGPKLPTHIKVLIPTPKPERDWTMRERDRRRRAEAFSRNSLGMAFSTFSDSILPLLRCAAVKFDQ
jgi:hypothetical protein